MNKKTWDKIQYWRDKLPWPYNKLVGTQYNSVESRVSTKQRKRRAK